MGGCVDGPTPSRGAPRRRARRRLAVLPPRGRPARWHPRRGRRGRHRAPGRARPPPRLAQPRHHRAGVRARRRRPPGRPHRVVRLPRGRGARAECGRVDPAQRGGGGGAARPTWWCSTRGRPPPPPRAAPSPRDPGARRSAPTGWPTSPGLPACSARCSARAGPPTRWPASYDAALDRLRRRAAASRSAPTIALVDVGPAADRARRGQLRERVGRARRRPQCLRRRSRGLRSGFARGDRVPRRQRFVATRRLHVRRARPARRVAAVPAVRAHRLLS